MLPPLRYCLFAVFRNITPRAWFCDDPVPLNETIEIYAGRATICRVDDLLKAACWLDVCDAGETVILLHASRGELRDAILQFEHASIDSPVTRGRERMTRTVVW